MSDCRFGVSPVNYPDLDPDDRVKFVTDASVWVTAHRALSALVFQSFFSNSAYPQHSGERYRTNGPLV